MAEIRCTRYTLGDAWQHLRGPVKIEQFALHVTSSSHVTCQI